MVIPTINDARHWRQRVGAMRTLADDMFQPKTKVRTLPIAQDYDLLAERAEERAGGDKPAS